MKVQSVYICEICNVSHKTKSAAKRCEIACTKERENSQEEKNKKDAEKEKWFSAQSLSEIAQNISKYLTSKTKIKCRAEFTGMSPNETCSNSHGSPIGKPSNWCAKNNNLPTGYMGIVGNLNIHIEGGYNSKVSSAFDNIRYQYNISTGCGGARGCGLGYQITVWADDFPNIRKKMEAYFKTIHQSGIYSDELNQIKSDHYYSKMNFIHNHEEYIAQEEVIRQAQKQMREIEESLVADFQNNNPIPKPKNEKVTWDDVRKIEQSFIN
jgi:hypothetical protein